ncbi:MAG: OB-fold domain-containing protein [Thermoplasmata archaeon]
MATSTADRRRTTGPISPPLPEPATAAAPPADAAPSGKPVKAAPSSVPFLLDFFPLESIDQTRLARFFDRLRQGRLSTTQCPVDHSLHWPPRVACPQCHTDRLDWVDLPEGGRIYAFSAVLAGAPLGMEAEVPFVVGLVDLDGVPLRIFGRIEGATWQECRIGQAVRVEEFSTADGRIFYRFRVVAE